MKEMKLTYEEHEKVHEALVAINSLILFLENLTSSSETLKKAYEYDMKKLTNIADGLEEVMNSTVD